MKVSNLNDEKEKRAINNAFMDAGWGCVRPKDGGKAGGQVIYFCDVDSSNLFIVGTIKNAVEILEKEMCNAKFTYEDICNAVGSLLGDLATGEVTLDDEIQNMFAAGAVMYIAGTQSYAYMKNENMPNAHFIVLRYYNHADKCHLLRPNPLATKSILTPEDIEQNANMIMEMDKTNHPERFKRAQVIPFRVKSHYNI